MELGHVTFELSPAVAVLTRPLTKKRDQGSGRIGVVNTKIMEEKREECLDEGKRQANGASISVVTETDSVGKTFASKTSCDQKTG